MSRAYPGTIASVADPQDPGRSQRLERLLQFGRTLTSELDLAIVLDQILETARELTGARYAALGVLDEPRRGLAQFLTAGLDDATREEIGHLPTGKGVLGLLIDHPEPILLRDVASHPSSSGFPAGHPPMRSFLGAPITIRGEAWGNLYLTEKRGGEPFDDTDLDTIVVLTEWAAVAIHNARLFGEAVTRREESERALHGRRAAMEIATAVGTDTDLDRVLQLIVKRGQALVAADALLIWLRQGDDLRIAAVSGDVDLPASTVIPLAASTAGQALDARRSVRMEDPTQMGVDPARYGMARATSALIVPLVHRDRGHGVLMAFGHDDAGFDAEDERALEAFAASAAIAVATAQGVEAHRLHDTMAAAESERRRWARELHDETLQGMASLKLVLNRALRVGQDEAPGLVVSALAQLESEIAGLRTIIADLRPAALDELGLEPALRTLVARITAAAGLEAEVVVDLGATRLEPDIETIAYRVAQEALTNVVKHAGARAVAVDVRLVAGGLRLCVTDDGRGARGVTGDGFGIVGMRERAALASGTLLVSSPPEGGTRVELHLPPGGEVALVRA